MRNPKTDSSSRGTVILWLIARIRSRAGRRSTEPLRCEIPGRRADPRNCAGCRPKADVQKTELGLFLASPYAKEWRSLSHSDHSEMAIDFDFANAVIL